MGAKKPKLNIPMCAALVLLLLTMVSIHMTSGLYARYTATASGSDSARVAKFQVLVNGEPTETLVECGATESNGIYTITIQNTSEVAVHYDLAVQFTSGADFVTGVFEPESGDLAVGETGTSTLTFQVDWNKFTADKTGSSAFETLKFIVAVDVTQID